MTTPPGSTPRAPGGVPFSHHLDRQDRPGETRTVRAPRPHHRRRVRRRARRGRPRRQGPRRRPEPHPGAVDAPGHPGPPRRHQRRGRVGCRARHRHRGAHRCARPARRARAARRGSHRPAPAAPGAAQRRPPGDPQPRHHRRLDRPRRPGRRDALRARADRRCPRGGRARWPPRDRRDRLLFLGPLETTLAEDDRPRRCGSPASAPAPARPSSSPAAATATTPWPGWPWPSTSRTVSWSALARASCPWIARARSVAGPDPRARRVGCRAPVPDEVTDAVREFVDPEGDIHATADYRRMLAAEPHPPRPGDGDPPGHPQPTRHPPPPRSPSHERADDRHTPRATPLNISLRVNG